MAKSHNASNGGVVVHNKTKKESPSSASKSATSFMRAFCRETSLPQGTRNGAHSPINHTTHQTQWDHPVLMTKASSLVPSFWTFLSPVEQNCVKNYWLDLKPHERSWLVSAEKAHVLTLFSRHKRLSCGCTFCHRRRAIVEEEIIALYDAYALELESFSTSVALSRGPNRESQPTLSELFMTYEDVLDDEYLVCEQESEENGDVYPLDDEDDQFIEELDVEDESDTFITEARSASSYRNSHFFPTDGPSREIAFRSALMSIAGDLLQNDGRRFVGLFEKLAERRIRFEKGPENPHRATQNNTIFTPIDLPYHPQDSDDIKTKEPFICSPEIDSNATAAAVSNAAASSFLCHRHLQNPPKAQRPAVNEYASLNGDGDDDDSEYDTESEEEAGYLNRYTQRQPHLREGPFQGSFEENQIEEGRRIFQVIAAKAFEQKAVVAFKEMSAMARLRALALEEQTEASEREAKAQAQRLARQKKRQAKKKKKKGGNILPTNPSETETFDDQSMIESLVEAPIENVPADEKQELTNFQTDTDSRHRDDSYGEYRESPPLERESKDSIPTSGSSSFTANTEKATAKKTQLAYSEQIIGPDSEWKKKLPKKPSSGEIDSKSSLKAKKNRDPNNASSSKNVTSTKDTAPNVRNNRNTKKAEKAPDSANNSKPIPKSLSCPADLISFANKSRPEAIINVEETHTKDQNGSICGRSSLLYDDASIPSGHLDIDDILGWTPPPISNPLFNNSGHSQVSMLPSTASISFSSAKFFPPPPGFSPLSLPNVGLKKNEPVIFPPSHL
ncbi:Stress response protein nst1 [Mitosporidium daphniae]